MISTGICGLQTVDAALANDHLRVAELGRPMFAQAGTVECRGRPPSRHGAQRRDSDLEPPGVGLTCAAAARGGKKK